MRLMHLLPPSRSTHGDISSSEVFVDMEEFGRCRFGMNANLVDLAG